MNTNRVVRNSDSTNVDPRGRQQTGADAEAGFVPRAREDVPKPKRFIAGSRHHALSVRGHC